ncbi:uncharacterized protein [Procambarus clarkii]|uniref:uncharacterized protein n=1 Tax=Procambarus clarkii TaxID=6728 RepID=UPI003743AF45
MVPGLKNILHFLTVPVLLVVGKLHLPFEEARVAARTEVTAKAAARVLEVTLSLESNSCSLVFLGDDAFWTASVFREEFTSLMRHNGVALFEAEVHASDTNMTQRQLSWMTREAEKVRQASWCVTVVVVSDDLAFLAAVAQWSLKSGLLVWSTRLLVTTRLPLHHLHVLNNTFSITNSMLLHVEETLNAVRSSVFVYLPYSLRGPQRLRVASWTPQQGFFLISSLQLFPDKFSKFIERPSLKVAVDQTHLIGIINRFGGRRDEIMEYFAQGLNFT